MTHRRSPDVRRTTTAALFTLVVFALGAFARPAGAQKPFDAKSAAHVRDAFVADMDSMHVKFMALAKAVPADKYGWRPVAGVRTMSEVFMHVAGEWYYWAPASMGGKPPADFGTVKDRLDALEKKTTSKDAVLAELEKSWAHCIAQLRAADPAAMTDTYKPWGMTVDVAAFAMAGDLHEHMGQLIAYARSVGVKPPWSK